MANRVRMEVNVLASFDVGHVGLFVQEEDQSSSLAQVEPNRPAADKVAGRVEEVLGKRRAVGR